MAPAHQSIDILASDLDLNNDDDPGTAMVPEELDKPAQPPSPPATITKVQKQKHQEKGMLYKPGVLLSASTYGHTR